MRLRSGLNFCLASIFITLPAIAADAERGLVYQLGIGRSSCAHWLADAANERDGVNWLLGYWTGVNSTNPKNKFVGSSTDGDAVVAEVKLICIASPSTTLVDATVAVYNRFLHEKKMICGRSTDYGGRFV